MVAADRVQFDRMDLPELRDLALARARERHDVGFLWALVKHLPGNYAAALDLDAYDPVDAVRELAHLVTHFREEAADPGLAPLLRERYTTYLLEHGVPAQN